MGFFWLPPPPSGLGQQQRSTTTLEKLVLTALGAAIIWSVWPR